MEQLEPRPYKLDLLISKRRRRTLDISLNNVQQNPQTHRRNKKTSNRKKIFLTVASRVEEQKAKITSNPQNINDNKFNSHVAVSEFYIEIANSAAQQKNQQNSNINNSFRQKSLLEEQEAWWKYLKQSQDPSRIEMLKGVAQKQKKIQFFIDLLKENNYKFEKEKKQKIAKYESYLNRLKQLYSQQLIEASKLFQGFQQRGEQIFYRELRQKINKDGKRGLNFSPKRMSLFSGYNDTLLLSKKTSGSQQKRRQSDQFSFGSSLRKRSTDEKIKQMRMVQFLGQGRIRMYKKRLNFNQT